MRMRARGDTPRIIPFRRERNATLDTLRWARKKRLPIPILLEVDVTAARRAIRQSRPRTGEGLSFTAWVVSRVARAAAEHPRVHSMRRGKRHLVLFDEVDVAVLVERSVEADGQSESIPMPVVVRRADRKSPKDITREIRRAQGSELVEGSASLEPAVSGRLQSLFVSLPGTLRDRLFWRWIVGSPQRMKRMMGTVVVTAPGTATPGILAWGVPSSLHPLAVGVGGIARRDAPDGEREVLALTVVFDHTVVDGAPVGRFVHRLHELLSTADGLASG